LSRHPAGARARAHPPDTGGKIDTSSPSASLVLSLDPGTTFLPFRRTTRLSGSCSARAMISATPRPRVPPRASKSSSRFEAATSHSATPAASRTVANSLTLTLAILSDQGERKGLLSNPRVTAGAAVAKNRADVATSDMKDVRASMYHDTNPEEEVRDGQEPKEPASRSQRLGDLHGQAEAPLKHATVPDLPTMTRYPKQYIDANPPNKSTF